VAITSTDRALFGHIWSLTWPMIISNGLDASVGLVDLLFVRSFGPAATAAMAVSRQVSFVVEALVLAISAGVVTLVSQAVGAKSEGQARAVVRQSIRLVLLLGVPTSMTGYLLSKSLLAGLQASPDTVAQGIPYLQVYFAGLVFLWGYLVGTALFRGAGDTRTPLKVACGITLLNVGLDYLLIYGAGPLPALGVKGAALGSVVARAGGFLAFLVLLARGSGFLQLGRHPGLSSGDERCSKADIGWGFDWTLMSRILRIGGPMALAGMLRHGSRLVFLAIVGASAQGVAFHAAAGVAMQLRLLNILPALAFQTATAMLVGQAIGRGDYQGAALVASRSVQLLALLMAAVAAGLVVFADPVAAAFLVNAEAAGLAATVLRWFAVAQLFSCVSIGTQGALMGAGDTLPAMRYTLLSEWAIMLPLAYILLATGWVPHGLLAAWTLAPALTLILMLRRFQSGKWKSQPS
jgi:putative MATE family efflux protein